MHYIADKCRIVRRGKWGALVYLSVFACEGWDSNPRTPTRQNLKSCTVGQALLPSQLIGLYSGNILKVLKFDD